MTGWPGVVVVEGDEEGVGQYVRKLHGLRWQQMVSRHILSDAPHRIQHDDVFMNIEM
jgi:hypothetical protein